MMYDVICHGQKNKPSNVWNCIERLYCKVAVANAGMAWLGVYFRGQWRKSVWRRVVMNMNTFYWIAIVEFTQPADGSISHVPRPMVGPDQELAPLTPTLPLHCADLQERAETKRAARGHRDPAARGDGDNASLGLALGGSVLTIHSKSQPPSF